MNSPAASNELATQQDFIDAIGELSPQRDLLLVMVLVTNLPIINVQFGDDHGAQVLADVSSRMAGLRHARLAAQISPVLFAVIAEDESNSSRFLKTIRDVITDVNSSGRFRFLIEASIGAVVTDHRTEIEALDWVARLNLAVLKSTRTGLPEMADDRVAQSESVRQRLARLSPGSAVPEGMYWVFQPINAAASREVVVY